MRLLYLLTVLCLTGTLVGSATANAAPFTVNTTGDAGDLTCDVTCTLRDAIDDANTLSGADEIDFAGAMTITPTTALPTITDPVTINGRVGAGCTGGLEG